jgi:hypothetical protein
MEGPGRFKRPARTGVRNAAAVSSGRYGSVTEPAHVSRCSRETVYAHAHEVEGRLAEAAGDQPRPAHREAEIQRLRRKIAELESRAQRPALLDPAKRRKFATVAAALGRSLRQTEDLLRIVLPPGQAPDHSTIGRWAKTEARRAGEVLKVLDRGCATKLQTLALDEIFLGGDRPRSASSHHAAARHPESMKMGRSEGLG